MSIVFSENAADAPCLTLAVLSPAHFKRQHAGGVAGGMVGGCRAAVGQPAVSAPAAGFWKN